MRISSIFSILTCLLVLELSAKVSSHSHSSESRSRGRYVPTNKPDCDGVPTIPEGRRRACGLYIWNIPSSICYKWCHHLLKDKLFEGRGGKMFVRFEPNSMLQLLYPCSRYSPDQCAICGGSYDDHLTLWWSKNMYSPFDKSLDDTYQKALTVQEADLKKRKKSGVQVFGPPTFRFHRRYVTDVSDAFLGFKTIDRNMVQKWLKSRGSSVKLGDHRARVPHANVVYVVPKVQCKQGKNPSLTLQAARALTMRSLDRIIRTQENANRQLHKPSY